MKLSKKEKQLLNKVNESLNSEKSSHYASETHRADKWTRSNIYRNRKAYTRKAKHKEVY